MARPKYVPGRGPGIAGRASRAIGRGFARLVDSRDAGVELHTVAGIVALIVFNGLVIWTVIKQRQPFDPVAYGAGLAGILSAVAVSAVGQGVQRRAQGDLPPLPPDPCPKEPS